MRTKAQTSRTQPKQTRGWFVIQSENWANMRMLLIVLSLFTTFVQSVGATAGGRETFLGIVSGANECLRSDMIEAPPDAVLFRYSPCLAMISLVEDSRTWYESSYPLELPRHLEAAATLTRAAGDLAREMMASPNGLWRADVLALLDLSDAYLTDSKFDSLGTFQRSEDDEIIFAAVLSATSACLHSLATLDYTTVGRGGEWLLVYCGPRVKLVEDQVNDTVRIADLPPDLVAAADSLLNAAALLPVLAAPESNGSAASEILLRLDQANDHILAWEVSICRQNAGNANRCPVHQARDVA